MRRSGTSRTTAMSASIARARFMGLEAVTIFVRSGVALAVFGTGRLLVLDHQHRRG